MSYSAQLRVPCASLAIVLALSGCQSTRTRGGLAIDGGPPVERDGSWVGDDAARATDDAGIGGDAETDRDAGRGGGPRILELTADRTSITDGQYVTLSVIATDPDGPGDVLGATITDADTGAPLGALEPVGAGNFATTVFWSEIHDARPIDLVADEVRTFAVTVIDATGATDTDTFSLTLTCGPGVACDGRCATLDTSSNCGACGNGCRDVSRCVATATGHECRCPDGYDFCGADVCQSLALTERCGACGAVCSGGTGCFTDGAGDYECRCFGDEVLCAGTCTELTTEQHCGACGNRCPAGTLCQPGASALVCGTSIDERSATQSIAVDGGTNTFRFNGLPSAVPSGTDMRVTVTANGDYNSIGETGTVVVDGTTLGTIGGAGSCGWRSWIFTVLDTAPLVVDGTVVVSVRNTSSVDRRECSGSTDEIYVRIQTL